MNNQTREALEAAHKAVSLEIEQLLVTKRSLEEAISAQPGTRRINGSNKPNGLFEEIAGLRTVLPKTFRNRDVIAALRSRGYQFSLSQNHVAKTLGRLVEAKRLTISGGRNKATYQFQ